MAKPAVVEGDRRDREVDIVGWFRAVSYAHFRRVLDDDDVETFVELAAAVRRGDAAFWEVRKDGAWVLYMRWSGHEVVEMFAAGELGCVQVVKLVPMAVVRRRALVEMVERKGPAPVRPSNVVALKPQGVPVEGE